MKKKLSLEENQIVDLNHRGSRNFQNECKLLDSAIANSIYDVYNEMQDIGTSS